MMARCHEAGVTHFVLPNVSQESIADVKKLHARFPDCTSMAIGVHPTDLKTEGEGNWKSLMDLFEKEISQGDWVAIGEVGIDLYWDQSNLAAQQEAFEAQLRLAEKHRLPVIIHSRSAFEETLEVIRKVKPTVTLIFHSFTGNKEDVKQIREVCDPYFGINGVVTYKNAPELRDALHEIGLERMVLETDAPYLTPVPHRGKRNESSYLTHIRDKIAETLDVPPEKVEEVTDRNAAKIFGI